VIDASVEGACNSLNALSNLSPSDEFYWNFIISCCNHVQPDPLNLANLKTFLVIVFKLGKIFKRYCTIRNVSKSQTYEVPEEIVSNDQVKGYFEWIGKMHVIMKDWQSKFLEEEFNYDDVLTYQCNLTNITYFAKAVKADHLVISDRDIKDLHDRYSSIYCTLSSLLVKGNKEFGW